MDVSARQLLHDELENVLSGQPPVVPEASTAPHPQPDLPYHTLSSNHPDYNSTRTLPVLPPLIPADLPSSRSIHSVPDGYTFSPAGGLVYPEDSSPSDDRPHPSKLQKLKEKISHIRKHSNGEPDKISVTSSESTHSEVSHDGHHKPSIINKLVRKLKDRSEKEPSGDSDVTGVKRVEEVTVETVKKGSSESVTPLAGSLPGQNVTTPEEPFLLVGGNPKFASGTSLVSPVDPPAMYCENVAFRSDGGLVPIPGEVVEKEETRAKTDLMEGYLASLSPLLIMGGIAIAVLAVPMPTFMKGFLFGCILMGTAGIRIWFTVLYPKKNPCVRSFKSGTSAIIPADPSKRYVSLDKNGNPEPPSTWMNQMIGDFHMDTFHVNQTLSVYVTLEGSALRIRKPKERVVARRAMFDEQLRTSTFTFIESRVYNIEGADVFFVPQDIPRKRRWLWRFPIGVKLKDPASIKLLIEEAKEFDAKKSEEDAKKGIDKEEVEKELAPAKTEGEKEYNTLYLMPRSNREKEDWYWRLREATGQTSFPAERPWITPGLSTLNAFVRRICYDVLTEDTWAAIVTKKIQKKLSVISLPFFIEELHLVDVELGNGVPTISDVSERPGVDERGLWAEMNFEYDGTVQMTLSTKLNLMKLKDKSSDDSVGPYRPAHREHGQTDREANLYESDEEDEFDEDAAMAPKGDENKLMRYMEKIKHSKVFQKLTDVGVVRRAMENVSDTEIQLTVTVERIAGRLAINIAHPPSDKLWWGFVDKPQVDLRASPKLGEKEVTMDRVIDWIEKKMTKEIHRMVTVPNMDDISIPLMSSTLDDPESRLEKLSNLILK